MATEHENAFFRKANRIAAHLLTDEGFYTFDSHLDLAEPYEALVESLRGEIIDNCTRLIGDDRTLYINRIEIRLKNISEALPFGSESINGFLDDLAYPINSVLEELEKIKTLYATNGDPSTIQIKRPSLRVIALKYAIEGKTIDGENNNSIAKQYGYTSGQKLQQFYNNSIKSTDRVGDPGTLTMLENQISRYDEVIKIIDIEFHTKAIDECEILSRKIKSYK